MSTSPMEALKNQLEQYREFAIQIQTKLTSIPALGPENGGEGEYKKMQYVKSVLNEVTPDTLEEINAPDDRVPSGVRPNIVAIYKGQSDSKTIWIMAHMDIVPPGDMALWDNDPYSVIEKDGKLYGRGTEDNQQAFVSALLAVKAFKETNTIPEYDIGLLLVADEETGSKYGIGHILEERADLFRPDDMVIVPDAGDPDGIFIEVAEKSILWVKCETRGKQTHGSTPEKGCNAHKAAAHLIVKMNELYTIFNANDPLYDPPISTFEPTQKEANVENVNTIPGYDVFYFDCRILPSYPIADVQKQIKQWVEEIEKQFGVEITLTYPQEETAPDPTPADTPAALALQKAVKDITGKETQTIGIGGGTVAAYFREKGLPAVCWATLDDTLHAPNEYSKVDNLINDAKVFAHIFLQK